MKEVLSSSKHLNTRFLVSCSGSGSTLLMKVFAGSLLCTVTSGLILKDNEGTTNTFDPDYSILNDPSNHSASINAVNSGRRFIVSKEEIGDNSLNGDGPYNIFPTPSAYDMTKLVFLVRDAIRLFDS